MWITKPGIMISAIAALFLTTADPQPKSPDKNKEYVCVRWSGSGDFSQNRPSICLQWELKDKPWFRKT
jgi:hypothetical protein